MGALTRLAARLRESALVRNSGWILSGNGLRVGLQAAYFVLIARSLGVEQYGAFVSIVALVSIVAPFAGFGSELLLLKNVSRDRTLLSVYWGNGLLVSCASGLFLLIVFFAAAHLILPNSVTVISVLCIGLSDLVFARVVELASIAFQALETMRTSAQLLIFISTARLIGIVSLRLIVSHPTAESWAVVYLCATTVTALAALISVTRTVGQPRLELHRIRPEFIEGVYFSVGLSAQTIYNDIDKTMLARMVALDAAGIYAAAYRIIDVAFTPVRSLLIASYPRTFQHGLKGIEASRSYGLRLTRPAALYSLGAAVVMFAGAPLLPIILGPQFARTAEALRWLALLPLLKTLHYFMANALTGAGFQGTRTLMQIIVGIFNVILNLWIIPAYSWRGAAWSSLASDSLLATLLYAAVSFKRRRADSLCSAPTPEVAAASRTSKR